MQDCLRLERSMVKKSSRLEIQKNSLSRLGVKLWNEIPRYITDLPVKTFKLKLLFDILQKEDAYIQIPMR